MNATLRLNEEILNAMQPAKRVYSPHSLPSVVTKNEMQWSNPDDQFIITLNRKTMEFSGHFYDWNEETQDWDDANDKPMDAETIKKTIISKHLLLVK